MANVQLENGYIRIAFDLFNELNFRDFNRMHLNILNFIIRLSYGCKKKYAYISPKSLFRLYGVNKNYIKQSLDYLINNKIIIVQNDKYYSINKNFDEWTVPYKAGVNFEEFKKIVSETKSTLQLLFTIVSSAILFKGVVRPMEKWRLYWG